MNIPVIALAFILPTVAAELKTDDVEMSTQNIVTHGVKKLSQDDIIQQLYPTTKHSNITNSIRDFFSNNQTHAVGLGRIGMSVGMSVRGEGCNDILFFDPQGTPYKFRYNNDFPAVQCALNVKVTFWGDLIPHLTALYGNGDLVRFRRKIGLYNYKWLSTYITNISDLEVPSEIEQLTTFSDGEILCYSPRKLFVLREDGQELCRAFHPKDSTLITDVVSTYPKLKRIGYCTLDIPLQQSPELHTWKRATKWDQFAQRSTRFTGVWRWIKLPRIPSKLEYDNNNSLLLDGMTVSEFWNNR